MPFLPAEGSFVALVWGGTRIRLRYREALGLSTIAYGSFERAEIEYLCGSVAPGATAIDVGANVGLFSVALGRAVGPCGRVIAVEPIPENVERLEENLALNELCNVTVRRCAAAEAEGHATLILANDLAYASTTDVPEGRHTGERLEVRTMSLDRIWVEAGSPRVVAIKIDVEGGELGVLKGAAKLLAACNPVLLVETNTSARFREVGAWLESFGYRHSHPAGFCVWNHVFRKSPDHCG
jgi:FkbM family methyltransferase